MELFGLTIARTKALTLSAVPVRNSWLGLIRESFTGAWQRNIEVESTQNILAFSAVYACISLIADDVSKLRIKLVEQLPSGIWRETDSSAFSPVLRKQNRYQTRIQFLNQWIVSKLLYGNTYVLKDRDARGIVTDLFILDPRLVIPLVANDGSVWYRLKLDYLSGIGDEVTVPASEIIHDRTVCLFHPLVGISPIYACGASTTQGIRIQNNSEQFFKNMSRPSGQLTAPGAISNDLAKRLKDTFKSAFSGTNIGDIFVAGDGLKFEPFGFIPAQDAQLIEQLRWTVEDVARCFHVPLYKIGGPNPTFNNVAALNQDYYTQTLQSLIEAIELLLDEGLALPKPLGTELDLTGLLRMDPLSVAQMNEIRLRAGYLKPNEARASDDLEPVEGGGTPYLQQQNYSLSALADRDATNPLVLPAPTPQPTETPAPAKDAEDISENRMNQISWLADKELRTALH